MSAIKVNVKRLRPGAKIPMRATKGSSGFDLCASINAERFLKPHQIHLIPTGIAISLPADYEAQVRARSGLATKGVLVVNGPGTIDSDYRGEIKVILGNISDHTVKISPNERIAQLVISPVISVEMVEVNKLGVTERGSGGFGHTG